MSYEKDKLEYFKKSILKEAEEEAKKLIEEAMMYNSQCIEEHKKKILKKEKETLEKNKNEIKFKYDYKITKKKFEIKKEILKYRNSLKEEIIAVCKKNIKSFTKTNGYREYLIEKIKKNFKKENVEQIIIEIKEEDSEFEDEIKSISDLIEVKKSKEIYLGGFKLIDIKNKIEIDETFDSALIIVMNDFYKTTNLNVKNF